MDSGKYSDLADRLINRLKSEGFTVQRYDAFTSDSVYLKLDYGLCYSVRISDHPGKSNLQYTFNLIKGYVGKPLIKRQGVWRLFYSFNSFDKLVKDILSKREWVKQKYHPDYEADMEKARIMNQNNKGFWSKAVLV